MPIDHLVGKTIHTYRIEEKIGQGGMASVYRAYQPSVNRSIALKVISLEPESNGRYEEFRRRFEQEAQVIAALEHIHILPIYDYGIVNDEYAYISMRLLKGGTLANLLTSTPLPNEQISDLLTQIARGLSYAHSKGVLHRDLKPSNILLDDTGNAFLSDFGLAKLIEDPLSITRTDVIVGTPAYMSPEQLRGENADPRSDIYCLGVILYHMLSGKQPFEAQDGNVVSVIYQHLEKMPEPPSTFNPAVTPDIDALVLKAMSKRPEERYNTANELANAFNAAIGRAISTGNFPAVGFTPPSTQRIAMPTSSAARNTQMARPRTAMIIAGLIAVMALVVVVLYATGLITPPAQSFKQHIIREGVVGTAAEAVPSEDELRIARDRLGSNGFIAYAACVQSSQYHAAQAREVAEFAEAYGLRFRLYNANDDALVQQTQIEQARADGLKALIICPVRIDVLTETLQSAQDAGIPMVFMAAEIENFGGVLLAGDDSLMGQAAGWAMGNIINSERGGEANIIILDYPNLPQIVTRANAMEAGVREIAPNVNIVGRYLGGVRANAEESVQQLIAEGVEFDAILSINDAGSYGAIDALEAAGIDPSAVIISSVDAEPGAKQNIIAGHYMRASVDVGRELFSRAAVDSIVRLMAGATMPETLLVPPGETITRETLIEATQEPTS